MQEFWTSNFTAIRDFRNLVVSHLAWRGKLKVGEERSLPEVGTTLAVLRPGERDCFWHSLLSRVGAAQVRA